MTASLDNLIFEEMMTHPAFFTHANAKKIAIISETEGILQQVLKHEPVIKVWHLSKNKFAKQTKVTSVSKECAKWFNEIKPASLDLIIIAAKINDSVLKQSFNALHSNGILVLQSESPFELTLLKTTRDILHSLGFADSQILNFPQPNFATGWRSALMAIKQGTFKRISEKTIFNKPFATHYYNFDVHKAALVLPEFMRQELK